jgi:glyoxylase I family protein
MSPVTLGLDHPAVAAQDPAALAAWYRDTLDYQVASRNDKNVWIIEAPDKTFIEVMPKDATPRPERTTWTPGWSHLAFRVADFDAAVAALEARGVAFVAPAADAIGGGKVRNFHDPEGNLVQIVWRPR